MHGSTSVVWDQRLFCKKSLLARHAFALFERTTSLYRYCGLEKFARVLMSMFQHICIVLGVIDQGWYWYCFRIQFLAGVDTNTQNT